MPPAAVRSGVVVALMTIASATAMLSAVGPVGGEDSMIECSSTPGSLLFHKFLVATSKVNATAMQELVADDCLFNQPLSGIVDMNKTEFISLFSMYPGGLCSLWLEGAWSSGRMGAAVLRESCWHERTTLPNATIRDTHRAIMYETTADSSQMSAILEVGTTDPDQKTMGAWSSMKDAFKAQSTDALDATFNADPTIYELPCGGTTTNRISKEDFLAQTNASFTDTTNSKINDHQAFFAGKYGCVFSANFTATISSPHQHVADQMTMYTVDKAGKIDTLHRFSKVWSKY